MSTLRLPCFVWVQTSWKSAWSTAFHEINSSWMAYHMWQWVIIKSLKLVPKEYVFVVEDSIQQHTMRLWLIWKWMGWIYKHMSGVDPGGGPGPPLDPRFWGPTIEHFWALFNFSLIFFASLCSAYYFFNMLLFQSSNSKIFQPRFARHMISHLEVFVFSLSFTHFRLLGGHLSLSFF